MAADVYGTLNAGTRWQHQEILRNEQHNRKRQILRDFSHRLRMLLTDSDHKYLTNALTEYQMYGQVDKLVSCLLAVLDTPTKLDLLKDIRFFITARQVPIYDKLAPYHQMAHPWRLTVNATMPRPRVRQNRIRVLATPHQTPRVTRAKVVNGSTEVLAGESAPLKVVTVLKDPGEGLGFSIRGGSEHGLGIFVSEVEAAAAADRAGLEAGDNIIEVNSVSFDNLASSSAVKVLTGSDRLKLIVRRVRKVPGFKSAKEKTSWYDVAHSQIVEGQFGDHGSMHHPAGLSYVDGIERRINLMTSKDGRQFLGFNIRGGSEYGLGIYVSKVDEGGLAEEKGLKIGDQILEVNNRSFQSITHTKAVDTIQSQKRLMLTVKDVGKYPAFKEIYAEYQWVDTVTGVVTKTRTYQKHLFGKTGRIDSVPVRPTSPEPGTSRTITEWPKESRVESYAQTDDETDDEEMLLEVPITHPMDRGIQTDSETDTPSPNLPSTSYPPHGINSHPNTPSHTKVISPDPSPLSHPIASTSSSNLLPQKSDIVLKQRPPEIKVKAKANNSAGRHRERAPPRPTLAVRAMELETRAKHPELAHELDNIDSDNRFYYSSRSQDDLDIEDQGRSRSLKDIFLIGSKSKGSKPKSATQGAKSRSSRKSLASINFSGRKSREDVSSFDHGMGSQLNLREATMNKTNLNLVEQCASPLLNNPDEVTAVCRHIERYEQEKDIELLLRPLLEILDSHEKLQLLRDIRSVIRAEDLAEYDRTVVNQEQHFLTQRAMKETPNAVHLTSPGRKPIFKSTTRDEEYKQEIEAQQRNLQEMERTRYQEVLHHGPLSIANLEGHNDLEEVILPDRPDAKYDYEVHRLHSNSRVYKSHWHELHPDYNEGDHSANYEEHVLPPESAKLKSSAHHARRMKKYSYSGPFLEDNGSESSQYLDISEFGSRSNDSGIGTSSVSSDRISPKNGVPRKNGVSQRRGASPRDGISPRNGNSSRSGASHLTGISEAPLSPVSSESSSSPLYAKVNKKSNKSIDPLPNMEYVESESLYAVYEDLDRSTTSYHKQSQPNNSSLPDDDYDTQSDTYAEAKLALGFLDDLGGDSDSDSGEMGSSTRKSSDPLTPCSEISSLNGSRFGSYDINVSEPGTPESQRRSIGDDRSPPRFVAPPPPTETPPDSARGPAHPHDPLRVTSHSPRPEEPPGLEDWTTEGLPTISALRYMKKQTSLDFSKPSESKPPRVEARPKQPPPPPVKSWLQGQKSGRGNVIDPALREVTINKTHRALGFSISGGGDSSTQPDVRVDQVFPGGAAAAEGSLKPGMIILSVDGQSLRDCTHTQAVSIIRRAFGDKLTPNMVLHVKEPIKV